MARKAYTLRLDADLYEALTSLSQVVGRSMNDLITEAVSNFVVAESDLVARDLEKTLIKLRAYRQKDPDFEQAIDAFVDAEIAGDEVVDGVAHRAKGTVRLNVHNLLTDG